MKKPILLIGSEEACGLLKGVKYKGQFLLDSVGKRDYEDLSAIIFDISEQHQSSDIKWLQSVDIPIVVLLQEQDFPLLETPKRRILKYPITKENVIRALKELNV